MSFFDERPLVEGVDVRVDPQPGASDEIETGDVNKEKEHGMNVNVDSFHEDGDIAGDNPAGGESEAVVLEEVVSFVQDLQLVNVFHDVRYLII